MKLTKIIWFTFCCLIYAGLSQAATLKDKNPTIFYPVGHYLEEWPRTVGTDMFGYNYQARRFGGSFANVYLGGDGYPPYMGNTAAYYEAMVEYGFATSIEEAEEILSSMWYWDNRDERLVMKWNDPWLSNKDLGDDSGSTVPDGNLDRHYGYPTYSGSGAWVTNHRSGTDYIEKDGELKEVRWSYFIKIITPPSTAVKVDGVWYTADGVEIGPERFDSFAAVQMISNDPVYDENGKIYGSPNGSGFGIYGPE
jgi:hypothetical protein